MLTKEIQILKTEQKPWDSAILEPGNWMVQEYHAINGQEEKEEVAVFKYPSPALYNQKKRKAKTMEQVTENRNAIMVKKKKKMCACICLDRYVYMYCRYGWLPPHEKCLQPELKKDIKSIIPSTEV